MKRSDVVALISGTLFALGLGLSGMTDPAKVIAFLNVTGAWDPSLAFVMFGAIGVHMLALQRMKLLTAPPFVHNFSLRPANAVDTRLIVGASLFGVGWGAAGFCPGPALVSLVALRPTVLVFVAAMLIGMGVFEVTLGRRKADPL